MTGNPDQIAYWNAQTGDTWATLQERLDRQLEPLGLAAMAALSPKAGERILDIGCGAGQTTLALAQAVAPGGDVLGVDISQPLLEVARKRGAGTPGVSFSEGDAQVATFEPAGFDGAFSRFGVMFFADPPAAFRNIGQALKPGGRLAFVCWRRPDENPVMVLPMTVAASRLPPELAARPGPPGEGPGPFAFADPARIRTILTAAGFEDIEIKPHDEKIGSGHVDQAMDVALRVGPLGALLRENPQYRDAVVEAVREALTAHETPNGVRLDSATWIVTARRP